MVDQGTAPGTLTTLTFAAQDDPGFFGLDDISVKLVPEPGSAVLLGLSAVGLLCIGRPYRESPACAVRENARGALGASWTAKVNDQTRLFGQAKPRTFASYGAALARYTSCHENGRARRTDAVEDHGHCSLGFGLDRTGAGNGLAIPPPFAGCSALLLVGASLILQQRRAARLRG